MPGRILSDDGGLAVAQHYREYGRDGVVVPVILTIAVGNPGMLVTYEAHYQVTGQWTVNFPGLPEFAVWGAHPSGGGLRERAEPVVRELLDERDGRGSCYSRDYRQEMARSGEWIWTGRSWYAPPAVGT